MSHIIGLLVHTHKGVDGRQALTADSPWVFSWALMFNMSRSLMPSVEGMSENACVCVGGGGVRKKGACEEVNSAAVWDPSSQDILCRSFCSRHLNLTDKTWAVVWFSFSPFPLSSPLCLFFLPPPCLSSLVHGLVYVYLLCPQRGKLSLHLNANIHSAIISNLFHTSFRFHSV